MAVSTEATMLVLSGAACAEEARTALRAAAEALGHKDGCSFATLDDLAEYGGAELAVRELDPWAVVAIDDAAIEALQRAFGAKSIVLAADRPVVVDGYTLVAVPHFAACLDDLPAKRVAWSRLKAARHPGNPLN